MAGCGCLPIPVPLEAEWEGPLDEFNPHSIQQVNLHLSMRRESWDSETETKFPIQVHLVPLENDNYEPNGVQETKHHHRCYTCGVWQGTLPQSGGSYSAPG